MANMVIDHILTFLVSRDIIFLQTFNTFAAIAAKKKMFLALDLSNRVFSSQ